MAGPAIQRGGLDMALLNRLDNILDLDTNLFPQCAVWQRMCWAFL